MRTARARTSVEKRFPGLPFSVAYLLSFLFSGKLGLVHFVKTEMDSKRHVFSVSCQDGTAPHLTRVHPF
jgi:hypothetical protein